MRKVRVRVRARASVKVRVRVRVRDRVGLGLGLGLANPNPNPNLGEGLLEEARPELALLRGLAEEGPAVVALPLDKGYAIVDRKHLC